MRQFELEVASEPKLKCHIGSVLPHVNYLRINFSSNDLESFVLIRRAGSLDCLSGTDSYGNSRSVDFWDMGSVRGMGRFGH